MFYLVEVNNKINVPILRTLSRYLIKKKLEHFFLLSLCIMLILGENFLSTLVLKLKFYNYYQLNKNLSYRTFY